MDTHELWERIYGAKPPDQVSWYRPHLDTSLALIERVAPDRSRSIIDVGGGASTLVDDLIAHGYRNVTVLDISQAALEIARKRLGPASQSVRWLQADVTDPAAFSAQSYDVWHDRAVFHFLTTPGQRLAYVRSVVAAVKPGGHVIVGTFGPAGPQKCSGLDVVRYDADSLHDEFGRRFRLLESSTSCIRRPSGLLRSSYTATASSRADPEREILNTWSSQWKESTVTERSKSSSRCRPPKARGSS